jgi:hypothetical protein
MFKWSKGDSIDRQLLLEAETLSSLPVHYCKALIPTLTTWANKVDKAHLSHVTPISNYLFPVKKRVKNAIKAESVFLACLGLWIYLPIPGGYMMPMLGSIFAAVLAPFPNKVLKKVAYLTVFWSAVYIAQFVFIMPVLTEGWQIAGLYFVNAVVLWKTSEKPELQMQKLLAGNYSVLFAMGALQLTPSYSITNSFMMIIFVFIALAVTSFFNKVYNAT